MNVILKLTVDEANLILAGLGSLPFNQVYPLPLRIQQDVAQQVRAQEGIREVEPELPLSDEAAA